MKEPFRPRPNSSSPDGIVSHEPPSDVPWSVHQTVPSSEEVSRSPVRFDAVSRNQVPTGVYGSWGDGSHPLLVGR